MVIANNDTAKEITDILKTAYFFYTHEKNGKPLFTKRSNAGVIKVKKEEIVQSLGEKTL